LVTPPTEISVQFTTLQFDDLVQKKVPEDYDTVSKQLEPQDVIVIAGLVVLLSHVIVDDFEDPHEHHL
jgi:hypothetical protein